MPAGLLGIEELDRAEIEAILARAKDFQPLQSQSLKKLDTLRGKMIVNLFYEASTRTRTSFEIAAKRMGADAVSITASGVQRHQGRIAGGYVEHAGRDAAGRDRDAALGVGRSAFPGAASGNADHQRGRRDARASHAGAAGRADDSGPRRESLEGLRVAIIGDIAHSRVARSNVHLLSKFGVDIVLCGPASLLPRGTGATGAGRDG